VVAGLQDGQFVVCGKVDQPVLFVDPPGPRTGDGVLERFRLAEAGERVTPGVLNDELYSSSSTAIRSRASVRPAMASL
jgi:hypothetical protein